MPLISLHDATMAFGGAPVLDDANLAIELGERIALLGRNGSGKSTLLQILDGAIQPDKGMVVRAGGATIARLAQEVPHDLEGTINSVVLGGLGEDGRLLAAYQDALNVVATDHSELAMAELDRRHRMIDAIDGWTLHHRVEVVLQKLSLDGSAAVSGASGGQIRKTLLARALVAAPDVLLLDEPTNHLDIRAIEWIEDFLVEERLTTVFVTHDRAFLRRVATRVVELDRGRLISFGNDYGSYLVRKEEALQAEERRWELFDKRLAEEEAWIRTGVKARRTRNEGRVRALEAMRVERAQRREHSGSAEVRLQEADRSGRMVIEVENVDFGYGESSIARGFSTRIMRGDRIGIIGPNGAGKSTMIRLLLGELIPRSGRIRHGTNLEIVHFDQLREQLDPERTVAQNVADGNEWVRVGGSDRHIVTYLQDFLFRADRLRTPVSALSGGERNRLLLARLFTRPFNVLVLDEPTNDLDVETLEVLESLLADFNGTLILASHDRDFIDATVTSTLVLEGGGKVGEYAGGYSDWLRQRALAIEAPALKSGRPAEGNSRLKDSVANPAGSGPERKRKLSFREARELEELPDRIVEAERERDSCYAELTRTEVLRDGQLVTQLRLRSEKLELEIQRMMDRWEELESIGH